MIQNLLNSLKQRLAAFLARIVLRLVGPQRDSEPQRDPFAGPQADVDAIPPFTGTPEEAFVLLNSPPAALLRKKVIARIPRDGSIPQSAEFLKLTAAGKALAHVDFIVCDDFGAHASPSQAFERCHFCCRAGFKAVQPCNKCSRMVCTLCAVSYEEQGQKVFVCVECESKRAMERNNWAADFSLPLKTVQPPTD